MSHAAHKNRPTVSNAANKNAAPRMARRNLTRTGLTIKVWRTTPRQVPAPSQALIQVFGVVLVERLRSRATIEPAAGDGGPSDRGPEGWFVLEYAFRVPYWPGGHCPVSNLSWRNVLRHAPRGRPAHLSTDRPIIWHGLGGMVPIRIGLISRLRANCTFVVGSRRMFRFSILYLFVLFAALTAEPASVTAFAQLTRGVG